MKETLAQETVRTLALRLTEIRPGSHYGTEDVRVGGKIFVTLPADANVAVIKSDPVRSDELRHQRPGVFEPLRDGRWLRVQLDGLDEETMRALLEEAWQRAVPRGRRSDRRA